MKISRTVAAAVAGFVLAPAMAAAAVIGGTNYASQYDYGEFFSIADHHDFKVVLAGNPFPGSDLGSVARDLLPVMQAAKPRPALTFAYDVAVEKDQPDYRLVLVFNAANDLGSKEVCNGVTRANPAQPGLFRPMPSTAATTWRCRRPRPGRRPAAPTIRRSPSCSASCSWSCSPTRMRSSRRSATALASKPRSQAKSAARSWRAATRSPSGTASTPSAPRSPARRPGAPA